MDLLSDRIPSSGPISFPKLRREKANTVLEKYRRWAAFTARLQSIKMLWQWCADGDQFATHLKNGDGIR
jgi:hypothetical protein